MVLADLGRRINSALAQINKEPVIDEKVCNLIRVFSEKLFKFIRGTISILHQDLNECLLTHLSVNHNCFFMNVDAGARGTFEGDCLCINGIRRQCQVSW